MLTIYVAIFMSRPFTHCIDSGALTSKVEVKDQQIQTEITETGDQSGQTRIAAKQQGVCTTVC